MNIVNKLTIKHMRMNKRRTMVTILGVIISAAMITAVAALSVSFMDLMIRDCIARSGLWHVAYDNLSAEQLRAVSQDSETKTAAAKRQVGYVQLENPKSMYRPYLYIEEYNEAAMKNFPIHLTRGRLPKAGGELAVTEDFLRREAVGWKEGDTIFLNVGQRYWAGVGDRQSGSPEEAISQNESLYVDEEGRVIERLEPLGTIRYTIVGVIETPPFEGSYYTGYTGVSYFDPSAPPVGDGTIAAYVEVRKPDGGIFDHADQLAGEAGIETHAFNQDLLRFMGIIVGDQVKTMLFGLSAVIMTIIIVGSVSLIYNAFAISVSERFQHLGMLSSVGATARQKRNSVFFEGAVIGLVSIPLGILGGLLGIGITFRVINPIIRDMLQIGSELHVVIHPVMLAVVALLSMATIFISVYIPARRASRVSPIDAIRQSADVRISGKALKTSRLTARLFGVEGNVALKNLKRNKRRYQATVFSLIISLVLFLTVSYFGDSLQSSYQKTMEGFDYDVSTRISSREENPEQTATSIMNAAGADSAKEVKEFGYIMPSDSEYSETRVVALDDTALREYAAAAGIAAEPLFDAERKAAIAVDSITYKDVKQKKYVTKKVLQASVGDSWQLYANDFDEEAQANRATPFSKLTMAGFTDLLPSGVSTQYSPDSALFIVSKAVGEQIFAELGGIYGRAAAASHYVYLNSSEPERLTAELEALENPMIYIFSVVEMHRQEEQLIFLMSVFVYGFITLITLICIANIFNTISTSIALRRREFAMLRSVGMTPGGFNRMIRYESIFYGLKALLYGLPLSVIFMYILYRFYGSTFEFPFVLPWTSILAAILVVFAVVFVTMMYAASKVKKENIMDSLKQEIV